MEPPRIKLGDIVAVKPGDALHGKVVGKWKVLELSFEDGNEFVLVEAADENSGHVDNITGRTIRRRGRWFAYRFEPALPEQLEFSFVERKQ